MEVSSQLQAPANLPQKNEPLVAILYEAEWPQSRYGRYEEKNSALPGLETQVVQPVLGKLPWQVQLCLPKKQNVQIYGTCNN
jgi:hypothetical protein